MRVSVEACAYSLETIVLASRHLAHQASAARGASLFCLLQSFMFVVIVVALASLTTAAAAVVPYNFVVHLTYYSKISLGSLELHCCGKFLSLSCKFCRNRRDVRLDPSCFSTPSMRVVLQQYPKRIVSERISSVFPACFEY